MNGFSDRQAFRVAAGLAIGLGCGITAAVSIPVDWLRPVADLGLPAELATVIWLPILLLAAVCGLALIWMHDAERREARRHAAAERQRIAAERWAYRRAVDQYLREARRARAEAQRQSRQRRLADLPVLRRLTAGKT